MIKKVKQVLGSLESGKLHHNSDKKLAKSSVLYYPAKDIVEKDGAHCGKCMMFFEDKDGGKCTVVEGAIDGPTGVCGLYVHGKHMGPTMDGTLEKSTVGYIEDGPTQCGNCEYYIGDSKSGICRKVAGRIEFRGCCNLWEANEELLEPPEFEIAEHLTGVEEDED